ncbi:MAG TPA: hypothetical protein DCQ32_06765 [Cyanobacteria bacterium UBA8156]|nr:hypothetical protein [Cyanobacteria bacterium UBA8156]
MVKEAQMDPLEVRVSQLHQEVSRLAARVDALPQRLLEVLMQLEGAGSRFCPEETHKDVLPETWAPLPLPEGAPELGMEWQVRRLMARLSCANNRIAQLEEQLALQLSLHGTPRWRSPNPVRRSV